MKLRKRSGCGQRSDESAWFVVISAVSAMKTNGARTAIAPAISRLCCATDRRNLRRRTCGGGRRRTMLAGTRVAVAVTRAPPSIGRRLVDPLARVEHDHERHRERDDE